MSYSREDVDRALRLVRALNRAQAEVTKAFYGTSFSPKAEQQEQEEAIKKIMDAESAVLSAILDR